MKCNNSNDCGASDGGNHNDFFVGLFRLFDIISVQSRGTRFSLGDTSLVLTSSPILRNGLLNVLLSYECSPRRNQKIHRCRVVLQKCRRSTVSFGIIHKNFASKSTIENCFQLAWNLKTRSSFFFFSTTDAVGSV